MNLTDKLIVIDSVPYFHQNDVREFVKELKEKAKKYKWKEEEIIDKLAGLQLI